MKNSALGLIEVKGLLASIEAADAAMKAANVNLIGLEKVKGGLVTVKIHGDVSAITSAVEAGAEAVNKFGTLISKHVIPNPDDSLYAMVKQPNVTPVQTQSINQASQITQAPSTTKTLPVAEKLTTNEGTQLFDKETRSSSMEAITIPKQELLSTFNLTSSARSAGEVGEGTDMSTIDRNSPVEQLQNMTVSELREEAKKLGIVSINNKQLKQAKKTQLVQEITKLHKEGVTT
ncbi:BMC domain-containing protein [Brevibacillus laterosporus]|uniref:BMC domain-containing protein n=1 Tax=Brevibacillus laterosporus TaxID=1465 RepID=A0A518VB46_BRELA|nr:BMC domain-containing protein [Brevibacillus laterosporus]